MRRKQTSSSSQAIIFLSIAIAFFVGGIAPMTNNSGRSLFVSAHVFGTVIGNTVMAMTGFLTWIGGVSRTSILFLVRKILWWVLSCAIAVISIVSVIVANDVLITR
jgi:hypothetical protein